MNIKIHLLVQTKEMAVVEGFMRSAVLWTEHEWHVTMQEIDGTIDIEKTDNPADIAKACIEAIAKQQEQDGNKVVFIGAQFDGTHTALFVPGVQKLCVNNGKLMTCLFSDYLEATGYAHETEQNMVVSSIENNKPLQHAEHHMATNGNPDNPPRIDRKPRQKRKGNKEGVA
jgi:hypothetical protein